MPEKPTYEELEQRVKEFEKAEKSFRRNEESLQSLIECATDFVVYQLYIDETNPCLLTVNFVSPSIKELLGISEPTKFETWFKNMHPDDVERIVDANQRALKTFRFDEEYRTFNQNTGEWRWIHAVSTGCADNRYVNGILVDITDRRQAEEALRESEERDELALRGANMGTWDWRITTGDLIINNYYAEMLGYTLEEIEPRLSSWEELIHPDDIPDIMKTHSEYLEGKKVFFQTEYRLRHKSGGWVWILDTGKIMEHDAGNKPLRACGTHLDITDRRQAEASLRDSEKHFSTIFHNNPAAIAMTNLDDGRYVDVNKAWEDATEYTRAEAIGRTASELNINVDPSQRAQLVEMFSSQRIVQRIMQIRRKSGRISDLLVSGDIIELAGELCLLTMGQDITKQKQAEGQLFKKERQLSEFNQILSSVLEQTHVLTALLDLQFNFVWVNRAYAAYDGYEPSFFPGKNVFDIYPREKSPHIFQRVIDTGKPVFEEVNPSDDEIQDGNAVYWNYSIAPVFDETGKVTALVTTDINVTKQKQAEIAIQKLNDELESRIRQRTAELSKANEILLMEIGERKKAEERLSIALRGSKSGIWDYFPQTGKVFFDANYFVMHGYEPDEFHHSYDEWKKRVHPDDIGNAEKEIDSYLNGEVDKYASEFRYKAKNNDWMWILSQGEIFEYDDYGNPARFTGTHFDITDRKQAEDALRESELWMRSIFNSLEEAVFVVTPDRKLVNSNKAGETMFGYSKNELIDQSTEITQVDYDHFVEFGRYIQGAFDKNEATNFESVSKKKNGTIFPTEHTLSLLKNDAGEALGIVGIVRDISERKRAEEMIAASLKEKEVLLREIHHRVKNNMQVIISLMRMHSRRAKSTNLDRVFSECRDRINAMLLIHEALYKSENLSRIDFEVYLKKLCKNLSQAYGVKGKGIVVSVDRCNVTLNMDQGVAVGMVISELISNACKHAFPESKGGKVLVSLYGLEGNDVELIVQDDGKGLPREIDIHNSSSLGLQLVFAAVTREMGGTIKVDRGTGTRFVIHFKCRR